MEFKRFSEDKQEQIRQFVSYAQMMGLTGKDIRSIGDKLDRRRVDRVLILEPAGLLRRRGRIERPVEVGHA